MVTRNSSQAQMDTMTGALGPMASMHQRLRALSHPHRLQIVELLAACNQCVEDLQGHLGISGSSLSQHLRILRLAGIVLQKRRGVHQDYVLQPESLDGLSEWLIGLCRLRLDGSADERLREQTLEEYFSQALPRTLTTHPLKRATIAHYYWENLQQDYFYPMAELEQNLREECKNWKDLLNEMLNQGLLHGNDQYYLKNTDA